MVEKMKRIRDISKLKEQSGKFLLLASSEYQIKCFGGLLE